MAATEKWPDIAGRLMDKEHVLPVRVYYEDTDFGGGVYHANYLKFCERGRSDFLRLMGVFHKDLLKGKYGDKSLGFAVKNLESEFIRPARIDDLLEVHTRFIQAHGARLNLSQKITLEDEVVYRADITVVVIDGEGRPSRLPSELSAELDKFV